MSNLNVVLLGLPSAGKSTLLGSLQQVARSNGAELHGDLVDLTGQLEPLRQTALSDKYQPTRTAVAAYPMRRSVAGRNETVTLLDTSGAQAATLLDGGVNLTSNDALPLALGEADCVLLVVDISSTSADLKQQFQQFVKFLNAWQAQRGQAAKVGGLPVFLVLAKCDKLAREGESPAQWAQRIDEAKNRIGEQFQKALEASRERSFGRVDVHIYATAANRPGEKKSEPYHVAELFQHVFDAADGYRHRSERSSQTLQGALVGLGGIALLLLLIIGWYAATEPSLEEAALESQVAALLAGGDDAIAERVREPIEDRLKELEAVQANPAYGQLPSRVREQIQATESLVLAYQRLSAEYQKKVANPRLVQSEKQLADIEAAMGSFDEPLKVWPDTRLAKRHETFRNETAAIRRAIAEEIAWMHARKAEGDDLYKKGGAVIAKSVSPEQRDTWFRAALAYEFAGPNHKNSDRISDTTIPYRVVYDIDSVKAAQREWARAKARLKALREGALES